MPDSAAPPAPTDPLADTLMTSAEVGRVFGVADRTLRQWNDEGRLPPAIVISRKTLRWRRSDIEAFIANGGTLQHPNGGRKA